MAETGALVVCVPNFSEGRRTDVIDAICDALAGGGARLVYRQADPEHHRLDTTIVGSPDAVRASALAGAAKAVELIDMTTHTGGHPRMGAADVIPFVPLSGISMDEVVDLARAFAAELADELGIPVYLYDRAATSPERVSLAEVRKGEFEGLREAVARGERLPDFGPHRIGRAGATAVGARQPLVAFNVYLTGTSLTHDFNPRAGLRLNASYSRTDIVGIHPGYSDRQAYDGAGRMTFGLDRGVKLRLGYTFKQALYSPVLHPTEHGVDIGIEYSRPRSRTRATAFGFSVGPQRVSAGSTGQESQQSYGTAADFWLRHQMNRTWSLEGGYHRGMTLTDVLQSPTYTDGFTTGVGGFFNRRTFLQISGGYSTGVMALTAAPSPFTTYTGHVRMEVAANKVLATYAEYFYYFYDFDSSIQLPLGVPHGLTRNGVRVGLTLWIPVRHR
jgi:hypothetical protein